MDTLSFEWRASWIWGGEAASPRNAWRCFRRTFTPQANAQVTSLAITADSRYVLYINGVLLGRGPARSWPDELFYDEYDIGHLLTPGEPAEIAVLVMHYGVSTFQYLRGRGGLLLQITANPGSADEAAVLVTDQTWKTAIHSGYDSNASRISCQMGFVEHLDSRQFAFNWKSMPNELWEDATIIGPVGMQPWTSLVPRPIPLLSEKLTYPVRIASFHAVKAVDWAKVFDLRSIMCPESADHANLVRFCGLLASVIELEAAAALTIGIPDDGYCNCPVKINDTWYLPEQFRGPHPERYLTVNLTAGEHLLLIDITGLSHGHGFHLGIDAGGVAFRTSPFVAVGPFDAFSIIDHEPERPLITDHPDYLLAREATTIAELQTLRQWVQPVDPVFIHEHGVFTKMVWKTKDIPLAVPDVFQRAITANQAYADINVWPDLDSEIVIDFGKLCTGFIQFEVDAAAGTIIDGYGFEYLEDGKRQHTYQADNTFRYICHEGRQQFASVVRRGLRYLSLTFRKASRVPRLYSVQMTLSHYALTEAGQFHSSDSLLNEIWDVSRHTLRLCMEDTFVDCPTYEQAFWVGDARNAALVNYYTFGTGQFVEHCLKLVAGSARQTPLLVDQVPSGWNSVIPNWSFFWITACLEYYRYSANQSFVLSVWPHVENALHHYLQKINEKGLFFHSGWNLLDWAPIEQPADGIVAHQNMFLVKALSDAAELGQAVGKATETATLQKQADALADAINRHLWDDTDKHYVDCIRADGTTSSRASMQTQLVAYLCNIPDQARRTIIERYLVEPPSAYVQIGSPFMSFFYYEALAKLGRTDILINDMRHNYGYMIDRGATAFWEVYPWSGKHQNFASRSHCHAWSAGPAYFLSAYILGVRALEPGWAHIQVAPSPYDLKWAKGSVPLPGQGRVDVSWQLTGPWQIHLRIEAPASIAIDTIAPEGYQMQVEYVRLASCEDIA